ncbi:MAG: COX15/CtaA family protein [Chromatiaceae bacterium]|nr:COX15/CtaA family protein [Chromatiaceae bacterium]
MLGAYVRLSHAGLGCPDWPGCYGRLAAPSHPEALAEANAAFPERPVHIAKAWKEMAHRYLASGLGLVILLLAGFAWAGRRSGLPVGLPTLLVGLVVFQGLLGMWTVTLLVNPSIVTLHLAGGMATLALLWWLTLRQGRLFTAVVPPELAKLRPWAWLGLGLVCLQILLGGWTSTHYAALACPDFPTCHGGEWWPGADFAAGFSLLRPVGVDYEGGVLDGPARTAIHLTHRAGALIVFLYLGILALLVLRRAAYPVQRRLAQALLLVLLLQVGLGIANIVTKLPLDLAVAHNGGAALLLLTLLTLVHALHPLAEAGPGHTDRDRFTRPRGAL